jgi:ribose transport system substrate-binding protein
MILVNAVDPKAIAPTLKKARDAGVIVMAVDVGAEGADATVMSDNVQAGVNACDYIVQKLNGKGNVVIVNGPPVTAVTDRVKGCKQVFAKSPGIKVLSDNQNAGGSRDGGLKVMTDLLTAHPKLDAVFAINDPTGIGCELAMKQAGRSGIIITAVDGAPDAEVALKDPNSVFQASAAQNPYQMAAEAVRVGYDIMQGKKPANAVQLLPVPLITKANVKDYQGWVH